MPRVIVAIVRHGDYRQLADTPSAHQPFELTPEGAEQARKAANTLREMAARRRWRLHAEVDSSRLLRAWQTATLIVEGLAAELGGAGSVREFDTLAERGLGIGGNLTVEQIERVMSVDPRYAVPPPDWKSNSNYRLPLPGAESLMEAGRRVAQHIEHRVDQLRGQASEDTLKIVVGHGAAFRHAAYHLGILQAERVAALSMHHAGPVCFERLDDVGWRHVAGEWKVRARGQVALD